MRILFSCIIILAFFAALTGNSGCANIIPPSGGPRDSLPPQLLSARPADSTVNFRGDRIVLNFDEYVDLQDVANNLLFTPIFPTNPQVEVKGKTITVRLKDSLEKNTTYLLNFGNAIKDINEGNVSRNFTYAFSTGAALDSLTLSGQVIMAETGKIDTTLQVLLYRNLTDSAVIKERPQYAARLDRNGSFLFKNLPPGRFAIYALGNAGVLRRYLNKNQDFAFADSPVVVATGLSPVSLYAYKEKPATAPTPVRPTDRRNNTSENRLRYSTTVGSTNNQQDLLSDLLIRFETPLGNFDSTKLQLTTDSTFTAAPYRYTLDSTRKFLTIKTDWKDGAKYNLILGKEFATDTSGRQLLKTDTLFFNSKKRAEYGTLNLKFRNIDRSLNPVLQFVQNDVVVFSASIKNGALQKELFVPGEYDLRILFDRNNNGQWDPGQFFNGKIQPEIAKPLQRKLTIKAAWDNDFELDVSQ